MSYRSLLPAASALLVLLSHGATVLAVETGASVQASASSENTRDDAYTPNMDAPGRSTVPAPAFGSAPRMERRNDFSSQSMAFELRFGPYAPRVDDSTSSPVRDDFFGDKKRFQFGFEIDGQLWRAPHVGTLGVGLGWSYTRWSALNKPCDANSSCPPAADAAAVPNDAAIGQKSTFNIMPMYAVGVLRVDVLARDFGIPLVGYGKFGLGYALWWVNDGTGIARTADGTPAKDHSVGTQAALGAMFLLDILEPSAGKEMDSAAGINNSYAFFEWSVSDYDGSDQMNVGTSTWVTGLAVEF